MEIFWLGHSFFKIVAKNSHHERIVLAIDPFDESLGLKVPKFEADILLVTHSHYDHQNIKAIQGDAFLIQEPGEYEIKGVSVKGIRSFHDPFQGRERGVNTIYKINVEDIKICHLGDFGQKELTDEQVEEIGEVDILLVPVGGVYTIDAKGAANVIAQIEPKIAIPMHYKIPKLNLNIDPVEKFLKTMGVQNHQIQKKLKIASKDLPKDQETQVVLLAC